MQSIFRIVFIIAIVAGLLGYSRAFFSDTETSKDNILAAGAIDLKIDNSSYYNGQISPLTTWQLADLNDGNGPSQGQYLFFNFTDLKPDDEGEDTISLHVDTNPAWACADITLTKNDDVSCTEPESADDPTCDDPDTDTTDGELAQNLNFVFWADDGDNVLEANESILKEGPASTILDGAHWTLADSQLNVFGGSGPLLAEENNVPKVYYIGKAWCYGTLITTPVAAGAGIDPTAASGIFCDGTGLDNATQTDSVMADVSFRVVQARHNPNFLCNPTVTPTVTNTPTPTASTLPTPTPTPVACIETFASSVVSTAQGLKKDGTAITDPTRTNPANMLGAFDGVFFSLGDNGVATLSFTTHVFNIGGFDIAFQEITGGRETYPMEKAMVEASQDGTNWFALTPEVTSEPGVGGDGIVSLDLSSAVPPLPWAQFVRITDTTDFTPHVDAADGYDVDGLRANCGQPT